jgi:hypothetical protein
LKDFALLQCRIQDVEEELSLAANEEIEPSVQDAWDSALDLMGDIKTDIIRLVKLMKKHTDGAKAESKTTDGDLQKETINGSSTPTLEKIQQTFDILILNAEEIFSKLGKYGTSPEEAAMSVAKARSEGMWKAGRMLTNGQHVGVWKVGNAHIDDLRALARERPDECPDWNLVSMEEFEAEFLPWSKQTA